MTRYHRARAEVLLSVIYGLSEDDFSKRDDAAEVITVTFDWAPGTPPSGLSGPPENYDPGEGDEFVIVTPPQLSCDAEERLIEWLDANWERPADEPDPDWLREQERDDALLDQADGAL